MGGVELQDREIYKKEHVVDVDDTPLAVRTYMEQRDLRRCLNIVNFGKTIESAAEFGCGFGRMTQVLAEFTSDVTGLEREHLLVDDGRKYIPDHCCPVNFHMSFI